MDLTLFTQRLKLLMTDRNMNQTDLAAATGLYLSAINRYYNGVGVPELDKLITIADYFGVSLDYLAGRYPDVDIKVSDEAKKVAMTYDNISEADKIIVKAVLARYGDFQ